MYNSNLDLRGFLEFGKISGGYFVTTIINQLLPFLMLPVLTRYLTPAEYGGLALFTFYFAVMKTLSGVSIVEVISKHYFDSERSIIAKIIGNSIFVVGMLSLSTSIIIVIFYDYLKSYLNMPLFWLAIMPLASFAFIVFSIGLTVFRNQKNVLLFSKHQIFNTVINITISLFLIVILAWSWHGRALGIMISYFISALIVLKYLNVNGYVSFAISKDLSGSIFRVLLPLIPGTFQLVIISQIGVFFVQLYFSDDLLGLYSIGYQISTVIQILVFTLNLSWAPFFYEQISNQSIFNKRYITRMLYLFTGIIFAGVVFINISAELILKIMTTPEFYGAVEFIPWFTIGFMFHGFCTLLMPVLIKNNKQIYISAVSFLSMAAMFFLFFCFIDIFGYIGVAYAFCLTFFIRFIAFFYQAKKVMPLPWVRALKIWN